MIKIPDIISFSPAAFEKTLTHPEVNLGMAAFNEPPLYHVAVGNFGAILYSDDPGQDWELPETSSRERIWDVCFMSDIQGLVVCNSGRVLQTNDGLYKTGSGQMIWK
ncbi:MAG: hypothetical protein R6T99_00995 [Bacteroidales bacterium]